MNPRGQVLSEASDRELVVAFQSGDRRAYDEIYRRHLPRVRRVCRRMLANTQDIDEAAQETFIKAYQALGRFNGSYLLGPWLARIAANVCVDHLRSQSRAPCVSLGTDAVLDETQCGPEDVLLANDPRVDAAIHQIRPLHARALELRAIHGLSHQEIAARLSMTPAQVKALLHRARESFRRAWDRAEGWLLAPVVGLRSLGADNSAGSSAAALPGWGLATFGPSASAVADRVAAAAVAAVLAFAPFGVSGALKSETPDAEGVAPAQLAAPRHESVRQDDMGAKLATARRTDSVEDTARVRRDTTRTPTRTTVAYTPEDGPEPAPDPLLPPGVEPPPAPEPPDPPEDPGDGGDEPPLGPSGAGNPVRKVYELADNALDSLPFAPGN